MILTALITLHQEKTFGFSVMIKQMRLDRISKKDASVSRNKQLRIITASILVLVAIIAIIILLANAKSERQRNGRIIGDNPNGISIEDLPVCNYTGAGYLVSPCYQPNGTINL